MNEYDENYHVLYSADNRFVKQLTNNIYEVYHIIVIEKNNMLKINTVNFEELSQEEMDQHLAEIGLKFKEEKNKIVLEEKEDEIIEDDFEVLKYVLADKLSLSGAISNSNNYGFVSAKDLNEILLEHDIPHQFDMETLYSL